MLVAEIMEVIRRLHSDSRDFLKYFESNPDQKSGSGYGTDCGSRPVSPWYGMRSGLIMTALVETLRNTTRWFLCVRAEVKQNALEAKRIAQD